MEREISKPPMLPWHEATGRSSLFCGHFILSVFYFALLESVYEGRLFVFHKQKKDRRERIMNIENQIKKLYVFDASVCIWISDGV